MSGTGEGIFEPERGITRAEFLKLLMEAFGIETGGAVAEFADVPADSWAYPYVAKAYELGLVQGTGDGLFGAEAYISRADLSVMVRNALALKGGTAINLTIFNLPRLSVDIDMQQKR